MADRTTRAPPPDAEALRLAVEARDTGRLDLAISILKTALRSDHRNGALLSSLGAAQQESGDSERAINTLRRALAFDPNNSDAAYNLGNALRAMGRFSEAAHCYRETLRLWPLDTSALINLGHAVTAMGDFAAAREHFGVALRIKPDDKSAVSNLLSGCIYDPDLSPADILRITRETVGMAPRPYLTGREPDTNPGRKLRLGWLSGDLRRHPIANNLRPIVEGLDGTQFDQVFYSDAGRPDAVTGEFRRRAALWRETDGTSDENLARLVRDDRVDILVVVAARFDNNRPLFALHRASPVQISFYDLATSGLPNMDFFVADRVTLPPDQERFYTERIVRVPSLYTRAAPDDAPPVGPAVTHGGVTFGSFNNPSKINPAVLSLWGAVLRAVPGSRLVLKYMSAYRSAELRSRIGAGLGVEPERVVFLEGTKPGRHFLDLYNRIDIALDPFPFTGAATTFDALWMGVPVVTLAGETFAARWSASILCTLGLDDLVASTLEGYVGIAATLAKDAVRRAELRSTLRDRLAESPMCSAALRGSQYMRLFKAIWRQRTGHQLTS